MTGRPPRDETEADRPTGPPTPVDRLYSIVEQGLCTGCGICQSVAGPEVVRVHKVANGYERPVVVGDLDHSTVDRIYEVCPGTRIEGLPDRLVEGSTHIDPVWGPWRRIVRAWSADPVVRHEGSTGGVLTALAIYLLESGRVDLVLHARPSTTEPTFGERHMSFTRADVMAGVGARYGPTAPLVDVGEVLEMGLPFAFIGKPCDVAALRNLGRHDPRVDQLVRYMLTPVCGGYMPPAATTAFLGRMGVDPSEVTGLRYRGRGCPGPTRIETADGSTEAHYLDFWGEDESMWMLPWRCKVCPDGIGEAADLAAADTWPGGSPTREESADDPGTNAVVVRTAAGLELLEAAERDGALVVERDATPEEMSDYQPHQVRKKQAVASRYLGMLDEGLIVPVTARLRLDELAAAMPAEEQARQREGTRVRIGQGKATEPRPEAARPEVQGE
ncbi:MAG: Coenzyme F420 hydrogenase/dehydrogenase, beta subunit C-terminal domain [Acidimicrobiales bacterium]|nr:Coenzyme F420 hydrogenase/dehydrogenase, beta subunit C-terminal domain [Acidimicrobiales bacterium]